MHLRRIIVSAIVIGGCALTLSAASASASSSLNSVRSGKFTVLPAPGPSVSLTAVVAANATLKRGNGATAVSQPDGIGTYEVDFTNDVTACAYVATLGEPASKGFLPAGFITVVSRFGTPQGVYVATYAKNGQLKNLPFHVDVGC